MRNWIFFIILLFGVLTNAQQSIDSTMTLKEYLGYVKSYHPIVKQANLVIAQSEAKLLKARGAFDPKLEVDYNRKKFKKTEYYDKLNATFKIPTWYGVELKANFEENTGQFLNPELTVPENGLYSAGVSISLARGFLMNERMLMLKQAKLFAKQAQADQQILVNEILYQAALTYFKWLKSYRNKEIHSSFLSNARLRYDGVVKAFEEGERAAIDTLEAGLIVNARKLALEKANIAYVKSSLELSNYLWLGDNIPVELNDNILPDLLTIERVDNTLQVNNVANLNFNIEEHPKLKSLNFKYESLVLNKRLKQNKLLPQIDLQYNFLSPKATQLNAFNTANYKGGINMSFPLFLRKERGDLRLAKLKLQDMQFEMSSTKVSLQNKVNAVTQEIASYGRQNDLANTIVADYETLLKAEERKFFLGESSLFYVNIREAKLIETKLKAVEVENKYIASKASLFNIMATLYN